MTAITIFGPTGVTRVDALMIAIKWATTSLTISFPTDASFYENSPAEAADGFVAFNATQKAAMLAGVAEWCRVSGLSITEVTESLSNHADMRFAFTAHGSLTAFTSYPDPDPVGGDGWFRGGLWTNPQYVGTFAHAYLVYHEPGHALGLKHPHEGPLSTAGGTFPKQLADADAQEYSVMAYRSYVDDPLPLTIDNADDSFPQSLMMYDFAAIQEMYPPPFTATGMVWSWSPTTGETFRNGVGQGVPKNSAGANSNKLFMTVWDEGGPTYDLSGYSGLTISLVPGEFIITATAQRADLKGDGTVLARNIANALLYHGNTASSVRRVILGTGNNIVTGNAVDNTFDSNNSGSNIIDGVAGTNTVVYSGNKASYTILGDELSATITKPSGTDTLSNIRWLEFADQTTDLTGVSVELVAQW